MVAIEKFVILTFLQNWDKVFFFLPHLIVRTLRMHSRYNNNYRNDEFVAHLVELKLPKALMFEHPIWVKKTFSRRYILFCNFFSSFLKLSQYKICSPLILLPNEFCFTFCFNIFILVDLQTRVAVKDQKNNCVVCILWFIRH